MKYKVLHVIPQFSVGGREKVVHFLINGLDGGIFEYSLVSLKDSVPPTGFFTSENLGLASLGKKNQGVDLSLILRLRKFISENKFHIVHVHNPGTLIYGCIAAKLAGIKVIVNTEHGYSYSISKKKRIVEDVLRNHISVTIAVSHELKNRLCAKKIVNPEKVIVIHNGVDVERFQNPIVPKELSRQIKKGGEIIVGVVGRLDRIKGHEILFKAFSECLGHDQNIRLIVVGDGPMRIALEQLAVALNVNEKVLFLGNRFDIPEILSFINIFVLPSLNEGLSITLLEAMAAGKAIVATNVGGNPEVIDDSVNGILVPSNSPSQLAEKILELVKNTERRSKLGSKALLKVAKYFSQDKFVREIQSVYVSHLDKLALRPE
jgi:glycosyltransferase involved in cell wall biosynthesis